MLRVYRLNHALSLGKSPLPPTTLSYLSSLRACDFLVLSDGVDLTLEVKAPASLSPLDGCPMFAPVHPAHYMG